MKDALTNSCMLVRVNISVWTTRILDQMVTREVLDDKNAAANSGRFNKSLLPGNRVIAQLRKNANACRAYNYRVTLPWGDNGARILRNTLHQDHTKKIGQFKQKHDDLTVQFFREYEEAKEQAKTDMGDLFKANEYPTKEQLEQKFRFQVDYTNIPTSKDFRVDLGENELRKIKDDMNAKADQAVHESRVYVYERLADVVTKMAEKLKDPDAKFHDTLVNNIKELTDIADDLNITGDVKLSELAKDASELGRYDPIELRKSKEVRKDAADKATKVGNDIQEVMDALTK